MKHKFSLILILALLSTTFAWAQDATAFYQLPAGVFLSGMTDDGDVAPAELHAPHVQDGKYIFTSEINGKWQSGSADSKTYTLTSTIMKAYKIPHLTVGESKYQYGSKNGTYTANSYFYVGDSVMRYMTPAKLYDANGGTPFQLSGNYRTYTNTTSEGKDKFGVYFNNKGLMYIDGIRIPLKNNSTEVSKVEQLFPEGSHVILNIYRATAINGKAQNTADRTTPLYTDTLTEANYTSHSSGKNRGALNKKFSKPIPIEGPFVVELSDMKESGCAFTVYSSTEKTGENMWGYFINSNGGQTFPDSNTPLISVHAMFPVLEKQDAKKTLEFTSEGGEDAVAIISNFNPKSDDFTIDFGDANWISTKSITNADDYKTTGKSTLTFTATPNTTGKTREATITLKHHLKELTYAVSQEAPTLTPRDDEQEFVMSLQDDTVHNANGDKVTKVYLESEVSLKDTINVSSEKGLTKIDTTFGSENGKYYVCLTFTRAKYVQKDTDDKITVSFKDKSDNKYEYTIKHNGAGELTTKPDYHTFVVGPKGGTALAVDANNKITNVDSVRVSSKVPATNIQAEWYNDTPIGEFISEAKEDEKGSYRLIKSIKVEEEITTDADRLDSFRVFLPNCDTVKFYVRQEPTARVWQLYGGTYNEMEVNNKGGKAHFKEFKNDTILTLFSNTPVTNENISFEFTNDAEWVLPSIEIKHTATRTRDSILITFEVDPWTGIEPRSTDMKITVLGTLFTIPLTQKAFGIKLSHEGNSDTLVVPIAGGVAFWKGTNFPELHVDGTEAYPDNLLKVTVPDGVDTTRTLTKDKDGLPRTTFTFRKTGTVTADWSDSIFISFDSINEAENFEYHFKDTIFITQALMPSAYYEVPEGAFFAGMSNSGVPAQGEFYIPYLHYSSQGHKFSSSENGKWLLGDGTESVEAGEYSCPNKIAKNHIPQLQVGGKKNYQYGASSTTYNEDLYFYVGDSEMRYMTPARLWTDLVSKTSGQADTLIWYYQTQNFDTMGVFFNNIDTMYLDGISIPIKNKSATILSTMFKTNSKVVVNIYEAEIDKDGKNHTINREKKYWTDTLTQDDYLHPDAVNYGVLEKTFDDSISIGGPFVVELSEMKTSGCNFFIYSADVSRNKSTEVDYNRWGYNIKDGVVNYPTNYTPAISVHAMFPALYPKDDESLDVEIPAKGSTFGDADCPTRTVYANYKYETGKNGWKRTASQTGLITMNFYTKEQTDDYTKWYFVMGENKTDKERKVDVTFTFRGKTLTYHVTQLAPEPTTYTHDVTDGNWGTICLPWASTVLEGATFYNVLGTKDAEKGIALTPIESPNQLKAGKPYVFYATSNEIKVTYNPATKVDKPVDGNHIIGTFTNNTEVPSGKYIIYDNKLYKAGTGVIIDEYRAYFDVDNMEAYNPATAPARVVFFGGKQSPTDLEMQDAQCTMHDGKFLINGQLVIIKDNKMYNAQGIEL